MNPLNAPRGSIRAVIALGLVLGLVPVSIWGTEGGLAAYTGLAGFVLRDYFASREQVDRVQGPAVREAVSAEDV